jgi:hypothetical protein
VPVEWTIAAAPHHQEKVHGVAYTREQAQREGWTIVL